MLAAPQTAALPLSLTGKLWVMREASERDCLTLAQRFGLPEALCRILAARGVAADEVENFLNPSIKSSLPDPSHLLDMEKAAARIARAVTGGERIAVFGDYDVDGATSAALLARFLRAAGSEPVVYIPDRMTEGYGPNAPALLKLKEQGASVAITVDCGTLAFEPLAAAADAGLDVIVVDHHIGAAELPRACAVVNPNRLDETSPHKQLAAVGVTFLLCVAVNRRLREMGWFSNSSPRRGEAGRGAGLGDASDKNQTANRGCPPPSAFAKASADANLPPMGGGIIEPDLRQWLDLVALGTVCDVVPLTGLNRAFVAQGLKVMALRGNVGLRTALDLARITEKPGTYHAGFIIGPRINAGGRVGKSDLGVKLLTTEDEAEALALAKELERHNAERKAIEATVLEEALAAAERAADAPLLVVSAQGWHQGVLGIVAGRLKEKFGKPAAVIGVQDGIGKASARSVEGFDIGAAVISARGEGLLMNGGGHAMAAGFTVEEGKIAALTQFLYARAKNAPPAARQMKIDAALSMPGATVELVEMLERLGPFGQGNPGLRVALYDVVNLKPEWTGDGQHMRTLLIDSLSNARLPAIAFRAQDTKLAEAMLATRGRKIAVCGQLKINEWNGKRSVNMIVDDIGDFG